MLEAAFEIISNDPSVLTYMRKIKLYVLLVDKFEWKVSATRRVALITLFLSFANDIS